MIAGAVVGLRHLEGPRNCPLERRASARAVGVDLGERNFHSIGLDGAAPGTRLSATPSHGGGIAIDLDGRCFAANDFVACHI